MIQKEVRTIIAVLGANHHSPVILSAHCVFLAAKVYRAQKAFDG